MPPCRENRRRQAKRRKREGKRLAAKIQQELEDELASNSWLCDCGHWIEDGLHCELCGLEPPWGCPCEWCQTGRDEYDETDEEPEDWDPISEAMMEDHLAEELE